ncbi:hypothetical protein Ae201684_008577 [Aphanomyces euteiches]|uniref:Uncharacterized protein n=1 Tax=Aphanomyces euteiches TaxID=100861 RepID=A0A6G0X4Q7_9STRA|nr:hypothetical protein Ae201684_008577 [Aphanomyces euteiches]
MDGCQVPWIMTAYCYVDFERRWEMANTQKKQQRCVEESNNAAVYLESILRNTDQTSLTSCWGKALEIGIYLHLKSTAQGAQWIVTTQERKTTVPEEAQVWLNAGMTKFATQWQNYKRLGVAESIFVKNAYGLAYPLTLKSSSGFFQFSAETTRKMQWPLANDLSAIASNSSVIQGKSLIRTSPVFAYANTTPEEALIDFGLLSSPFGPCFSLVRNALGHFGSIAMRRIPTPFLLRALYQNISSAQEFFVGDASDIMAATIVSPNVTASAVAQREFRNIRLIYLRPSDASALFAQAQLVKFIVRDQIQIDNVQYIGGIPTSIGRVRFFDPTEVDLEFFTWLAVFDWAKGIREVVSFQGDNGTITALSSLSNLNQMTVNPREVPVNISLYMRRLLQYFTGVMLSVACIVCLYIIGLKGQIEASNMLVFSRVASIVWIGRPLVILRALSAISILSTATLTLVRPMEGVVSYFESTSRAWYMIILAAGELVWMVYVVNDLFSVVTGPATPRYASRSFKTAWVAAILSAVLVPPRSQMSLSRECKLWKWTFKSCVPVVSLVLGCCIVCYGLERWSPHRRKHSSPASPLVYAAAKYQFKSDKWRYKGVWHIDKASAVLTGILTFELSSTLYLFDIKTWRIHALPRQDDHDVNMPEHLRYAVPLILQ